MLNQFYLGESQMTNLTPREQALIKLMTACSEFNNDSLDFSKPWSDQKLEFEEFFEDVIDIKYYAKELKLEANIIKGILGSLAKKNMVQLVNDIDGDDKPMTWLLVYENNFNNIREGLAN